MKKSVSELQQDLNAANTMIARARRSGNKQELNLGREGRLARADTSRRKKKPEA